MHIALQKHSTLSRGAKAKFTDTSVFVIALIVPMVLKPFIYIFIYTTKLLFS